MSDAAREQCQKCYTGEPHEHGAGLAVREERRRDPLDALAGAADVAVLTSRVDGLEGQVRSLVEALGAAREDVARLEKMMGGRREE